MVVRLSLVIDSQALITEHMVSGEGSHDLLRAKQQVDNDMAFLRSQLRTLKPQDHPTVMEYLADETLEVREGEEAIKRVADLTRSSMNGIIQLAKDTGILFENLEYNPTPMKINETKLAQNEAGALTHLSELIGKKVVGELSRDNIDPLTLMNSGILPPLLITDRSANVDKLHINDQDRFIEHIVELAKTDEGIAAIREARRAIDDVGKTGKVTLIYAGGVRDGADMAKALALGADAIAIGTGAMVALNCNKEIPESNFEKEMGVPAGHCYHCHTGRCPVGVATQDPKLRKRLNPDEAALRVYNYLHAMTLEAQLLARACGKTNIHSLEPEDMAALTMEASALAKVPLSGTNHTVGVDDFHKI